MICLRRQQQFGDADDREQRRCLHDLGRGVDPGRQRLAQRLGHQHIDEDLREGEADRLGRLGLAARQRSAARRARFSPTCVLQKIASANSPAWKAVSCMPICGQQVEARQHQHEHRRAAHEVDIDAHDEARRTARHRSVPVRRRCRANVPSTIASSRDQDRHAEALQDRPSARPRARTRKLPCSSMSARDRQAPLEAGAAAAAIR